MRSGLRRIGLTVAGALLVVVGILGIFLPILPGVFLIIGGLALWSREYEFARRAMAPIQRWMRERLNRRSDKLPG